MGLDKVGSGRVVRQEPAGAGRELLKLQAEPRAVCKLSDVSHQLMRQDTQRAGHGQVRDARKQERAQAVPGS